MPVAELQARMSSREFSEWVEFYRQEPFGERVVQWQLATLCALIANVYRDRDEHPEMFTVDDFLPRVADDASGFDTAPQAVWMQLRSWAIAAGAQGDPQ